MQNSFWWQILAATMKKSAMTKNSATTKAGTRMITLPLHLMILLSHLTLLLKWNHIVIITSGTSDGEGWSRRHPRFFIILSGSLEDIDTCLHTTPNMKNILHTINKCFSLPANYPKGNRTEFKYWAKGYHPDAPLYPIQQSSGSHNNMVLEGAIAAYINEWLYK